MTSQTLHVVGHATPRADAEKVTGGARYASDVQLPGTVWGKALRSPYPHARIVSINTSAAKNIPGVHAVVTGEDLPPGTRFGRLIFDVPVLAQGVVRFAGEPVAAVVADDEDIAQQALDLIEVEYEELPALIGPLEAAEPDAIILHPDMASYAGYPQPPEKPTNVYHTHVWEKGDVDAGFKEAEVIVENTFTVPVQHHGYMEPHCCVVNVDADGHVDVWAPNKAPYNAKRQVAACIGVPPEQVRLNPVTIGGDFGGKGSPLNIPLCYFLSKAAGRPVRMIMDYAEEFMAANPRHSAIMRLKTGVKRDGTIVAHQANMYFNSGAYGGFKPAGHLAGAIGVAGPYKMANTKVTEYQVYTNTVPCGHMRGPGEPQAIFALESQIDCVARELGIDPVELRRRTLARSGEEDALGHAYDEVRAVEMLEAAVEASGYNRPKGANVGRGVAIGDRPPGGGETWVMIELHADGSVVAKTPIYEQGSGTYTILRQMVAEGLGMLPGRVQIQVLDTDSVANDTGVGGSRVSRVLSKTAFDAVQDVRTALFEAAAAQLGWPKEAININGDNVVRTDTEDSRPWKEIAAQNGGPITGTGHVLDRTQPGVTSFTAQVAEVEVDPETGQVKLLKITSVHDAGQVLNPTGYYGQINGGTMMGIGYGMLEELKMDGGRVSTLTFADYKIPNIADLPELKTVVLESDNGVGPYKVKGIGENANAPTAPAIANAVADAIGLRIPGLPITAEKVYEALQARPK